MNYREQAHAARHMPGLPRGFARSVTQDLTNPRASPGGHVESSDPGLRAALIREVREEVGADPQITGLLRVLANEHQREYFYLGHIQVWSEGGRTGPELDDPDRGEYRLEEISLSVEALDAISIEPEDIAAMIRDAVTSGTDLATLANPAR